MAALFILNIYYKDDRFELERNEKTISSNIGSNIFSIKIHQYFGYDGSHNYMKKEDFDECTYVIKQTPESEDIWKEAIKNMNHGNIELFTKHDKFSKAFESNPNLFKEYTGSNIFWDILGQDEYIKIVSQNQSFLHKANEKTKNEAILNKNQIN